MLMIITPSATSSKTNLAIEKLEQCSDSRLAWFQNNEMKVNAHKCHFLVSTNFCRINIVANNDKFKIKVNEINIESSPQEKLLSITLDDQLNFKNYMSNLCKKASQKLNARPRLTSFMDLPRRPVIMKAYINLQLGYCPLVWIMHNRSINN